MDIGFHQILGHYATVILSIVPTKKEKKKKVLTVSIFIQGIESAYDGRKWTIKLTFGTFSSMLKSGPPICGSLFGLA